MYWKFGGYQHPDNEVNLTSMEITTRFSPRGRPMTKLYRLHLHGELVYNGQSTLTTRINELINAYTGNTDVDCGLYQDDGTITPHKLQSSSTNPNNISGVKVVYRSWPKGDPEEYATCRTFYIILEAEYKDLESQLIAFRESVSVTGTTGPRRRMVEMNLGPARWQQVSAMTRQEILQQGFAIGYDGYPLGFMPGPILPSLELVDQRYVENENPEFAGRQFVRYRTNWRYVMNSPIPQAPIPNNI